MFSFVGLGFNVSGVWVWGSSRFCLGFGVRFRGLGV